MKVIFCSSAFIRNKKNQILIMSRKKKESFQDCWEFPGGKLNNCETYLEALVRELKEELSIKINININLNNGKEKSKVLTCDFSHRYIDINASYKT